MKKILYIANIRLPTEKAHGAQIMKTCEAFAHAGADLSLAVTNRRSEITEDVFAYYGIRTRFPLVRIAVLDTVRWGKGGFILESLSFALCAAQLARRQAHDVLYGRDEFVLYFAPRGCNLVWESHTGAWNFFARAVARRASTIVVISQGLKDFYIERGVTPNKIIIAHDGVDLEIFAQAESLSAARARLGLPLDVKVALYVGRIDGWKGTDTLCEAAHAIPEVQVVIIGGEEVQVTRMRTRYPEVLFLGYHSYKDLADNQAIADVLILPNTGTDEVSVRFTSPMKLFSYMASGIPIVASDLPSIREVIDSSMATLVPPDNAVALAQAIRETLADPEASVRAARAREAAKRYSWEVRARTILRYFSGQ